MQKITQKRNDVYEFQCYLFDLFEEKWTIGVFRKGKMIRLVWMREEEDIVFLTYQKEMLEKEYFALISYIERQKAAWPYRCAKVLQDVYYNYLKFGVKSWASLHFQRLA